MVNTMHIGRDDDPSKPAVQARQQPDICVIEHGCGAQQHFEDQYRNRWRANRGDCDAFDNDGDQDFERVDACPGSHVYVRVCVVYSMQTPQCRNRMDARRDAGLPLVRVHDLRHSFACRLRAAGVSAEDREALLGHANHSMAGHYASADVGHLLAQANLIVERSGTRTVLRIADSERGPVGRRSHTVPQQERSTWFCTPSA